MGTREPADVGRRTSLRVPSCANTTFELYTWGRATWEASTADMEDKPNVHERVGMLVYRRQQESGKSINYCYISRNMLVYVQ